MSDIVVTSAVRTAIGKFGGSLLGIETPTLGAKVIEAALEKGQIAHEQVDEVIMGTVYQGGLGPNAARQAAIGAGIPYQVPSMTINKLCGSGLKAVGLGFQALLCQEAEVVVAGGMENMSRAPHVFPQSRWGERLGHGQLQDLLLLDGLWDCFYDCHMGITAENLAEQYSISRQDQDGFALRSQQYYQRALAADVFKEEIVPLEIAQRKGEPLVFAQDEYPRADTSLEKLSQLRPAFKKDGSVTAGNAAGINDGAAALVLTRAAAAKSQGTSSLAYLRAVASAGVDPKIMGIGPAPAIRRVLEKAGMHLDDIDLIEVNEAFAAQTLAVGKELDWDEKRVNVNGGALALGHPVGASGARVAVSLLHEMRRRSVRWGIAALCIGGGMGVAALFERTV
jgi:acetyl-CoA C-acetyltransferase